MVTTLEIFRKQWVMLQAMEPKQMLQGKLHLASVRLIRQEPLDLIITFK